MDNYDYPLSVSERIRASISYLNSAADELRDAPRLNKKDALDKAIAACLDERETWLGDGVTAIDACIERIRNLRDSSF